MQPGESSQKPDRGAMEKQRRLQMKNLYSELSSLLRPQLSEEKLSLPTLLEKARNYVKGLKERVDKLKVEKERLQGLVLPTVLVNEMGSFLEVNILTALNKGFKLHEALMILEEEGAVVLNVDYSTLSDRILYTIRSQAFSARIGIATSRVHERLMALTRSGFSTASPEQRFEFGRKLSFQFFGKMI